jgi:tRNA (guanine-N7-)-methyltransferase
MHLRQVRSYVRRQARFTPGQKQALSDHWPRYGLELNAQVLDFKQIFGREAPILLEIGFGMGDSLLTMARLNPDKDFIGVEVHRPGIASLMRSMYEQQLSNLRIFRIDANEVLQQAIPDNSLAGVQLFFPDPWPKTRHHKRRIVQAEFVELIRRKLINGGIFHLATDWQDYAKHMLNVLEAAPGFINKAGAGLYSQRPIERPLTKFEQRGQRLGHGVWDLIFEKN